MAGMVSVSWAVGSSGDVRRAPSAAPEPHLGRWRLLRE